MPVISLLVPLAVVLQSGGSSAPVRAQPAPNAMAVDADPSDPDIDVSADRLLGEQFQVSFDITTAGQAWKGYDLVVDHTGLTFLPTDDLEFDTVLESWHYTGLGAVALEGVVQVPPGFPDRLQGAAARNVGTSMAMGQAVIATFQCNAPGEVNLHLVTSTEAATYSTTRDMLGMPILTDLADATITCSDAAPTPTVTPGGAAVGGIAEIPPLAGTSAEEASSAAQGSGWSPGGYAALAGGLGAAAFAIVFGSWYVRRRWLR